MNNDRLNFRTWTTVSLTDENDNDYEKSFMLYNVDPFKGYVAGIRKEAFEDQLEKQGFSEDEIEQIEQNYSIELCDDYLNIDTDETEQCTGLKDKNGKLIYEGDIVHYVKHTPMGIGGDRYAKVFWWDNIQGFAIETNCGDYYGLLDFEVEIVGNIHENNGVEK